MGGQVPGQGPAAVARVVLAVETKPNPTQMATLQMNQPMEVAHPRRRIPFATGAVLAASISVSGGSVAEGSGMPMSSAMSQAC